MFVRVLTLEGIDRDTITESGERIRDITRPVLQGLEG
jgi:hypothetical protein